MSAYGPALFITRADGQDIDEAERDKLVSLVADAAWELRLKDDDNEPVEPRFYDYDGCEPRALGVLVYSSYNYAALPDEPRADQDGLWDRMGKELEASMRSRTEGRYTFKCYGVEN